MRNVLPALLMSSSLLMVVAGVASPGARTQSAAQTQHPVVSTRLLPGSPADRIHFKLEDGLIYLPVILPSAGVGPTAQSPMPLAFVFDTAAAHTSLDPGVAAALGLKSSGAAEIAAPALMVGRRPLHLGVTPLMPTGYIGTLTGSMTAGVLGSYLLAQYQFALNYDSRTLALLDPDICNVTAETVPLKMAGGLPFVEAELLLGSGGPVRGLFLVDTGQPGAGITLTTAFQAEHPEIAAVRTAVSLPAELPGAAAENLTRVAGLRLGSVALHEPVVALEASQPGALSNSQLAGVLGADVLRRFNLLFNARYGLLYLEPNSHTGEPFEADMSGLALLAVAPEYRQVEIKAVMPGSPASAAHLQPGDRVVALDGRAGMSVAEMREALRSRPGQNVNLRIERGGRTLNVTLTLKRLV